MFDELHVVFFFLIAGGWANRTFGSFRRVRTYLRVFFTRPRRMMNKTLFISSQDARRPIRARRYEGGKTKQARSHVDDIHLDDMMTDYLSGLASVCLGRTCRMGTAIYRYIFF